MLTFYHCPHCGNVVWKLTDSGVGLVCCGQPMEALTPNTTDAAAEKHVPVISSGVGTTTVAVGSAQHPMEEKHNIGWIAAVHGDTVTVRHLRPGDTPTLTLTGEVERAFAWCNLHGLWTATPDGQY